MDSVKYKNELKIFLDDLNKEKIADFNIFVERQSFLEKNVYLFDDEKYLLNAFNILTDYIDTKEYSLLSGMIAHTACLIMNSLIDKYNADAIKCFTVYLRDRLFFNYLKNKQLYYVIANACYVNILGADSVLPKEGFRDIKKMLKKEPDYGFMDADYLFLTAWSAKQGMYFREKGISVSDSDYNMYSKLVDMYFEFTDFANQGYGTMPYNIPKEKKLYDECMKVNSTSASDDDLFYNKPNWVGLAYATAEAGAQYDGRHYATMAAGLETFCEPPTRDEQRNISRMKKHKIKRIVLLVIVVLLIAFVALTIKKHPVLYGGIIAFIAMTLLQMDIRNGEGSEIWYIGHHYVGPAYWLNQR